MRSRWNMAFRFKTRDACVHTAHTLLLPLFHLFSPAPSFYWFSFIHARTPLCGCLGQRRARTSLRFHRLLLLHAAPPHLPPPCHCAAHLPRSLATTCYHHSLSMALLCISPRASPYLRRACLPLPYCFIHTHFLRSPPLSLQHTGPRACTPRAYALRATLCCIHPTPSAAPRATYRPPPFTAFCSSLRRLHCTRAAAPYRAACLLRHRAIPPSAYAALFAPPHLHFFAAAAFWRHGLFISLPLFFSLVSSLMCLSFFSPPTFATPL